jgi:ATP-dependent Clp protease ATP-binding subunit ClpC
VVAPTPTDALAILEGLRDAYQRHHGVVYTPSALQAAIDLSIRYIPDRQLPDKAMDVLDEAGSRVRMRAYLARKARESLTLSPKAGEEDELPPQQGVPLEDVFAALARAAGERTHSRDWVLELRSVEDALVEATAGSHFEEAALLRDRARDLQTRLTGFASDAILPLVDVSDIADVVAAWSGVPSDRLGADEAKELAHLPSRLVRRVVGQPVAVARVGAALARARSGWRDAKRPVASFMFAGPTGVGKTELAKAVAREVFGSEDAMVRLDMSEYMERHSVSRLTGAPPGFVGYGEGGLLTEAVRRRPYCVLLLDEVEKAHPDVFNVLLQVLEDGRLTDSLGRTVSFKDTLVILTSNLGTGHQASAHLGFQSSEAGADADAAREDVTTALKSHFRPEFLNRLDDVIVFHPLSLPELRIIASRYVREVTDRVAAKGVTLDVKPAVLDLVVEEGYDPALGARPVRRAVAGLLEAPLSEVLLEYGEALGRPGVVCVADAVRSKEGVVVDVQVVSAETEAAEMGGTLEAVVCEGSDYDTGVVLAGEVWR